MPIRVRYAPSPTGSPHVGNVRTAIFNWLLARKMGGVFITRLEDTDRDPARYKPEYVGDIEESLGFLGIEPDLWWKTPGGEKEYVQSARLPIYQAATQELIDQGFAYRCYCTPERLVEMRAQQQTAGSASGYDRRCRGLPEEDRARNDASGLAYVVRLAVPLEGQTTYHDEVYGDVTFENRLIDDQVLLKSNGWPTYHLGVVVDDHSEGITHVIRGEDWMPSTPKQVLLYQAFGWEQPAWIHVPLIVGTDKKKLSKRHGSTQFLEFAREGYLPEAMFNFLVLLGWSPGEESRELFSVEEIVQRFGIGGINKSPAVFDYDKLKWMNGEYIRLCPVDRLIALCVPYLQKAGLIADPPTQDELALTAKVIPLQAERMKVLSDIAGLSEYFFKEPETPDEKGRRKWLTGHLPISILSHAIEDFDGDGELTEAEAESATERVARATGLERGPVIHTLRLAATGRTVGPGLFQTLAAIGRTRLLERFDRAHEWIVD